MEYQDFSHAPTTRISLQLEPELFARSIDEFHNFRRLHRLRNQRSNWVTSPVLSANQLAAISAAMGGHFDADT
jgi:hypothetical protein